ncbi:MAG TPA: carboxypeptidase-like regulatory domain-containing protein, partial [Chthoniobacterales bacterium]
YFQWNNTSFAIFNKATGALEYGPAAGNTLFQALGGICASHNDGDPVVTYDILSGRWVASQFVVGGPAGSYSHQCFAISTTSDATGEYYLYDFVTDPVNFVDYPHHATWPDGYYMSAHVFTALPIEVPPPPVNPGLPLEARVYVFERDKMIDGQPARMQMVSFDQQFGLVVADLASLTPPAAGEAEFVIGPASTAVGVGLNNAMETSRVKVTWDPAPTIARIAGPTIMQGLSSPPCLSGATDEGRDCVPQPMPAMATDYLDRIGTHYMFRLAYRNLGTQAAPIERLVVAGPSTGGASTPAHGAVEWFEFQNPTPGSSTTQPSIRQTGTYDPDTSYRWLPSASMDKDGNIAIGYSKSSTTVKPGIYITGRRADPTDPLNTMGPEVEMKAGEGVQLGGGNRWGDYSSMSVDPIDQCTFYYTNEYLKTNGAFNWSTRIASYKFPSCVSAANLYGIVTGLITSSETGAPISGVRVALSNDFASASDANGIYTILVPAGTYTASAADAARNCSAASPPSAMVSPPGGGTVVQDFVMTGTSKLEANGFSIDDALGNANAIVNRGECVRVNLGIKNNGCAKETAISAQLTTDTPGVTIVQPNSTYTDKAIDQSGINQTPFKISVSNSFGCGTDIALKLNLTYAHGTKSISYAIPTCAGGPDQGFGPYTLTHTDSTQADRVGRNGFPSTCSGKAPPGGGFAGTHYYKTFTFTNTAGAARCYTVTINAGLNGPGDIESVAYDQTYTPSTLDAGYLGDSGISGLGTTVGQASYSFTVPAGHNFVVVVNTTGSEPATDPVSSQFSGTVSGFINNNPGPGDCAALPNVPELTG